jgi:hypothetical protein
MDFFFQPLLLQKSISSSFQRENFAVNPRRTIKGVDLRSPQQSRHIRIDRTPEGIYDLNIKDQWERNDLCPSHEII